MEHRPARISDLDRIMEIIADAQDFLRDNGVDQWQNGYPSREVFTEDIKNGECLVFLDEGRIVGVISLLLGHEPSYDTVYDGDWLTKDEPYAVFHRSAVDREYRGKRVAGRMLSCLENIARENGCMSMRGDTHRDNNAMRRMLERSGYTLCGTVRIDAPPERDAERLCYEKRI